MIFLEVIEKEEVTNLIIKFFKSNCNKKYSEIKKI